ALFAGIPYQLHVKREAYYHSLLLLWLNLLGFEVEAEVSTDKGRIDAAWRWGDHVVVAEIKYSEAGSVEPLLAEALAQIHARRYPNRYTATARRVTLLAVAFAGKEIGCRLEVLDA
ncbi:MAG: PD-(D/E)XK nuclease domain-containing protein, partial [Odoribacteraceae bacterium]|nr:PD-(D/E)XK nuclease domain-containing protein [Odoribacteraceae bacterium]